MPDEVLTVAELEGMLARCELAPQLSWAPCLARVCRHALALEAEVARLRRQIEAQRHEVRDDDGESE